MLYKKTIELSLNVKSKSKEWACASAWTYCLYVLSHRRPKGYRVLLWWYAERVRIPALKRFLFQVLCPQCLRACGKVGDRLSLQLLAIPRPVQSLWNRCLFHAKLSATNVTESFLQRLARLLPVPYLTETGGNIFHVQLRTARLNGVSDVW